MPSEPCLLTDSDIAFIHETLEKMKKLDTEFRVAGSETHRYEIGPPIPEEELQRFEEEIGILLPADYRSFLTRVGPGAGPLRGVEFWSAAEQLEISDVQTPFPFREAAFAVVGLDADSDDLFSGVLYIGYDNSGSISFLVVNGPEYGMLWEQWMYDFFPSQMTFWQWYSRWLHFLNDFAIPRLRGVPVKRREKHFRGHSIYNPAGDFETGQHEHRTSP